MDVAEGEAGMAAINWKRKIPSWMIGSDRHLATGPAEGAAVAPPGPATTAWANPASGNWTSAANWTNGVPSSATDATIGGAGLYTVTLSGTSGTAHSLTISDPSATLALTQAASLTLTGSLVNDGTMSLDNIGNSRGSSLSVAGNLSDAGTLNIGAVNAGGAGGGSVTVSGTLVAGGTVNIMDDTAAAEIVTVAALADTGTLNLIG